MCCLFGLLDYSNTLSSKDKNTILSVLSIECEARGIDATGIAYNVSNRLCVYKRALPAHRLHYVIPKSTKYIMGHTRMTTQGSEKNNCNNHPFIGQAELKSFALAHNGILHNDISLRKSESLPQTKIQTDSFVAVQLIEKQKALNFDSLINMAEKVEGSFTFTVLDSSDNLYVVKGDNPFCMYHYPKMGVYVYASTEDILMRAIKKLGIHDLGKNNILLTCGDILKIDKCGNLKYGRFNSSKLLSGWGSRGHKSYLKRNQYKSFDDDSYLYDLKSVASSYGYSTSDIDLLYNEGFSCEEIENMLYEHDNDNIYNERSNYYYD